MKNFEIGAIVLGLVAGTVQADPVQWQVADGGNGHWYEYFEPANGITWDESRLAAESLGWYLVCFTTLNEQAYITDVLLDSIGVPENASVSMGLYKPKDDWLWIDGSGSPNYLDWACGEPNDLPTEWGTVLLMKDCDDVTRKWCDVPSDWVNYGYIVEWNYYSSIIQWRIEDGGNGHWYQAIPNPGILWEDANTTAISMGGYLATPTSAQENQFIYEMIEPIDSLWNSGQWNGPWLGGYQDTNAPDYVEPMGGWRWATDEVWTFTNWASGQPDDGGSKFTENHLQYWQRDQNTWNDIHTAANISGFVVEFTTFPGSALGACCLDGLCITTAAADCSGNSGSWGGPDSSCADFNCPESCPADVDGDGDVGVSDILMLIASWGTCP